jgi:hypothetical protein
MPEPRQRRVLLIGGGEESVGVEEETMHASGLGLAVRNLLGIESHSAHLATSPFIVLEVHCVLQKKRGLALGGPDLDGDGDRWTDDDTARPFFDQDGNPPRCRTSCEAWPV